MNYKLPDSLNSIPCCFWNFIDFFWVLTYLLLESIVLFIDHLNRLAKVYWILQLAFFLTNQKKVLLKFAKPRISS